MATRSAGIRVEGADRLRTTMRRAGDDLGDLKAAHGAAAAVIVPAAKTRTPRRTGALSGSIRGSGTKTQALIRAGGARVPYAGAIHWGWPARNIEPHPFISEAATTTENVWVHAYSTEVERILDRVKGA